MLKRLLCPRTRQECSPASPPTRTAVWTRAAWLSLPLVEAPMLREQLRFFLEPIASGRLFLAHDLLDRPLKEQELSIGRKCTSGSSEAVRLMLPTTVRTNCMPLQQQRCRATGSSLPDFGIGPLPLD